MAASPFSTYQEYYEATGPIYTLADRPALIGILTVLSAGIFLYFIYATYTMKKGDSGASMKGLIGLLLATSVMPIADAIYSNYVQRSDHRPSVSINRDGGEYVSQERRTRTVSPLAMLGMVGLGSLPRRVSDRPRSVKRRRGISHRRR